jgi:phosphoglycerate kinase
MPADWSTWPSWWAAPVPPGRDTLLSTEGLSGTRTGIDPLAGLPLLEDLPDVRGQKVLVRTDFNVPLRWPDGPTGPAEVTDDFRIRASMPTLDWLTGHGAEVTVCTHLGRPDGTHDHRFDMGPVRDRLARLAPGVELLDNLRFDPGEKSNDPAFVDRLVEGFGLYVDDAFGVCHRAHASIVGPPALLPSAAGRLVAREVEALGGLIAHPARPFVAVVGGAKVADKLGVLHSLLDTVDLLIVGGAMAFTFLAAQGHSVGLSLSDASAVSTCRALLDEAGDRVLLPCDVVVRRGPPGSEEVEVVGPDVPDDAIGLDIGPSSARSFGAAVADARTVFWNGPMGVFEDPRFSAGTYAVAKAIAGSCGFTVVGGGDSVAALDQLGLAGRVGFVSTGGGASLELLEHGDLPGLAALRHAPNASAAAGATAN